MVTLLGVALAEEESTRYPSIPAILITEPFKGLDATLLRLWEASHTDQDVQDRLCCEAWHCGAPYMLYVLYPTAYNPFDAGSLLLEERRPNLIVGDQLNVVHTRHAPKSTGSQRLLFSGYPTRLVSRKPGFRCRRFSEVGIQPVASLSVRTGSMGKTPVRCFAPSQRSRRARTQSCR